METTGTYGTQTYPYLHIFRQCPSNMFVPRIQQTLPIQIRKRKKVIKDLKLETLPSRQTPFMLKCALFSARSMIPVFKGQINHL